MATVLRCTGCGFVAPPARELPFPFRCPRAGDGADHVLARALDPRGLAFPSGGEANPFARYRIFFHAYHTALAGGMRDADYLGLVARLDARVEATDGRGFRVTPLSRSEALGAWVKDETGDVADSHKGRHLFGLLLYLEVIAALGLGPEDPPPLAIASCGNAALAAAVLARAAGRALRVFLPPDADPEVIARLAALGAERVICPRVAGVPGDPCVRAFRRAVADGALPFSCQGSDAGLTLDGGATLGLELAESGVSFDRVFLQVGGGALASAVMRGFEDARSLGRIAILPRFHAVQTRAVAPLARAWARLSARGGGAGEALAYAARHRAEFMWPWEGEPRSLARAILDDETYDWLAVVRGMLVSGGAPLTVDEETLARANAAAREATGIAVGPSGSAGLAGWMALAAREPGARVEQVAVIFSGVRG